MKKIILLFLCGLFLLGCSNEKNSNRVKKEKKNDKDEIKENYIDNNSMPISFYENNKKITTKNVVLKVGQDLGVFQIFPSSDEQIKYSNSYCDSFYNEWKKYDSNNNTKIGYNISYSIMDGRNISHTILNPSNTMDYEGYLAIYLNDDYNNCNKSWYSHVEPKDYTENTFFTSIKLFANGSVNDINSNIILTVFTYDTEDDFDPVTKEYRGKSKATLTLIRQ